MRLIDADAIVYTHEIARSLEDGHNWNELCVTQDDIEDTPTIDAVEVVRCKDCKHYEENDGCGWLDYDYVTMMKPEDFCSYGERKTDG